jgi:hypothetical protein
VAFELRDLSVNRAYIDELIQLGSRSTPTTVIEQEGRAREILIGFHQAELRKVLGI